jgi:hypothetical protein
MVWSAWWQLLEGLLFSPTLLKIQKTVQYWKSWLTERRTKKMFHQLRLRLLPIIDLPSAPTTCPTTAVLQTHIRLAQKNLQKAVKQAPELRRMHLEERAAAEAAANNSDANKIIKRIIRAEASSDSFKTLRPTLGKSNGGSLSSIMIPGDEPDTWQHIFDPQKITDLLIKRNIGHFGQAHGTPFTVAPLSNWVGWHGTSDSAAAILQGDLPPHVLAQSTEAARDILKSFQHEIAPPDSIDIRISPEDIRSALKSWKEKTSTSPSGQHLGYYHSILAYEPPPADDDTPRDSDRIQNRNSQNNKKLQNTNALVSHNKSTKS